MTCPGITLDEARYPTSERKPVVELLERFPRDEHSASGLRMVVAECLLATFNFTANAQSPLCSCARHQRVRLAD